MSGYILSPPQVINATGLPRSSLYAKIAEGEFPTPIKLSQRSVGWSSIEVDAWIQERDPHLAETLKHEFEGILQWVVGGAIAYEDQGLAPPALVRESDRLIQFLPLLDRTDEGANRDR